MTTKKAVSVSPIAVLGSIFFFFFQIPLFKEFMWAHTVNVNKEESIIMI